VLQIFTGTPPFVDTPEAVLCEVVRKGGRPPKPIERVIIQRGLDNDLWRLIKDCWAQQPTSRPAVNDIVRRLNAKSPKVLDPPQDPTPSEPSISSSQVDIATPLSLDRDPPSLGTRPRTVDMPLEGIRTCPGPNPSSGNHVIR